MAFQLKDFRSITASMLNWLRASTSKVTDYSVGSVARTLVEAPAVELDQLYQEMFHGLKEAIPTATYQSFDFEKLPARAASGALVFTADTPPASNLVIPAGTRVRNNFGNVIYETVEDGVIAAGQTSVTVLAAATVMGSIGNAAPNTITALIANIPGVSSVTNPYAFTNGRNEETDEERKLRFQGFISTLPRGTGPAIEYGARTAYLADDNGSIIESVALVKLVEPYLVDQSGEIALIKVYIHNGTGGTTQELVDRTQQVIDGYREPDGTSVQGWKAAGVRCEVIAATEEELNVTAAVTVLGGYDPAVVLDEAERAVNNYLLSLGIGEPAICAEIIERIMATPGVYNVALSAPAADTAVDISEKIMPGVITLTEA